jgi:hypothetical protein
MVKARSLVNVSFDGGGTVYEVGKKYDVPADLIKKYPDYFKKMAVKPENKAAVTEENK